MAQLRTVSWVWPIFNTADAAIVLGVAILLLSALGPKANQRPATGKKLNS